MHETSDAMARIDRALGRIETAVQRRGATDARLAQRHAALRAAMGEAIAALDGVIAREPAERAVD